MLLTKLLRISISVLLLCSNLAYAMDFSNQRQRLHRRLAIIAKTENNKLPIVTGNIRVDSMEAKGSYLVTTYTILNYSTENAIKSFKQNGGNAVRKAILQACSDLELADIMKRGAVIYYVYKGSDGGIAFEVSISDEDCSKL